MAEAARSRRHGEKMRLILLFSLSRRAFDPVSHPARTRERERAFLGTREREQVDTVYRLQEEEEERGRVEFLKAAAGDEC